MSKPDETKRLEIDSDDPRLAEILKDPDNAKTIRQSMANRYDASHEAAQSRQLRTDLIAQIGLNRQQHDIMQGVAKWQGNLHQFGYYLSREVSIALGGIDKVPGRMREKTFAEKYGAGIVLGGGILAVYFGWLYSPPFREGFNALFEPLSTRIMLAVGLIFVVYLYWRSKRRSGQT